MFVASNDEAEFSLITQVQLTFEEAEDDCDSQNSTLARISDRSEFDLVFDFIAAPSGTLEDFWIGTCN